MDSRLKDSIRATEKKVESLGSLLNTVEINQIEILKVMRSIKESVVRKYKK